MSIRQVAAAAGVSIATVSRVINNAQGVSRETAAKVKKVIEQLGYTPNPLAQVFGTGESRVLGIALPWFHGEYFSEMLRGADAEAVRLGYHLMITSITTNPDGKRRHRIVGSGLVEGTVLFVDHIENPIWRDAVENQMPTVVVGIDLSTHGLDSVILDNERGVFEAMEHLTRWVEPARCYFVGGPRENFDAQRRAAAFAAALEKMGHTPGPEQITFGDWSAEWGKEWAIRMVQRRALEGAGILAGNDEIACGICRAAEDARLWVPDQIRIIGFDDTQFSRFVRPRLSTVQLPMAHVGETAISMLVRRMDDRAGKAACVKLPTKLVVRESSTAMTF